MLPDDHVKILKHVHEATVVWRRVGEVQALDSFCHCLRSPICRAAGEMQGKIPGLPRDFGQIAGPAAWKRVEGALADQRYLPARRRKARRGCRCVLAEEGQFGQRVLVARGSVLEVVVHAGPDRHEHSAWNAVANDKDPCVDDRISIVPFFARDENVRACIVLRPRCDELGERTLKICEEHVAVDPHRPTTNKAAVVLPGVEGALHCIKLLPIQPVAPQPVWVAGVRESAAGNAPVPPEEVVSMSHRVRLLVARRDLNVGLHLRRTVAYDAWNVAATARQRLHGLLASRCAPSFAKVQLFVAAGGQCQDRCDGVQSQFSGPGT